MATRERVSSGGVQVLRAMFENGQSSAMAASDRDASRERGVSATRSVDAEAGRDSIPRPLTKVRTAFISVEDGGTARSSSGDRLIKEPDEVLSNGAQDESLVEPAAESQVMPGASAGQTDAQASTRVAVKAGTNEHQTSSATAHINGSPTTPKHKSTPNYKRGARLSVAKTRESAPQSASKSPRVSMDLRASAGIRANANSDRHKPQSPKTKKDIVSVNAPASPSFTRNSTSNAAKRKADEFVKTTSTSLKSTPKLQGTRSATGFVKPKPRSPTRPATLPSHLTAATTSSAAKRSESSSSQQLQSAQSGERSRRLSTYSVSSSRPSFSLRNTTASSASIARKASATFGPPPRPKAQHQSLHTASGSRPSDSFLARMMRPTTSSASKINEHKEGAAVLQRPRVASRPKESREASTPLKAKSRQKPAALPKTPKEEVNADTAQSTTDAQASEAETRMSDSASAVVNVEPVNTNGESVAAGQAALGDEVVEVVVASDSPAKTQSTAPVAVDDSVH